MATPKLKMLLEADRVFIYPSSLAIPPFVVDLELVIVESAIIIVESIAEE